jgi:ABC-type nitrate/sulfonate/bicarbonate transport system permease component
MSISALCVLHVAIGFVLGGWFGIFIAAVCVASRREDE